MMKSQTIRILDAVLIGPLMMYGGIKTSKKQPVAGYALAFLGAATVLYNAQNWHMYKRLEKEIQDNGKTVIYYEGKPYQVAAL